MANLKFTYIMFALGYTEWRIRSSFQSFVFIECGK